MLLKLADQLRDGMAYWPSGVAVLAVRRHGRLEAITLSSFISVSLEPPLVLVSIGQHAAIRPALDEAGRFTISVLAGDQARIASTIADRFPRIDSFFRDDEADPVLIDALTSIVCTTAQTIIAGDHVLYLGAVERVLLGRDADALVYQGRKYRRTR